MATASAAEQNHKGAGGKLRKTPFRRATNTTPYDRPASKGGWISKLVDPAHKLLTYSAHRLFSTVFHKRLTHAPSSSEASDEAKAMEKREGAKDAVETSPAGDGFTLLEQMLEHKTFTRPEIDRLKELLHLRTDEIPTTNLEKQSEEIPSMALVSHEMEEYAKTPLQDKSANNGRLSSPFVNSAVSNQDAASPVELAKAYMDSRPLKVSQPLQSLRSHSVYEDSHVLNIVAFPSKSPLVSVSNCFSGNGIAPENGFATPRSRGRSAIHSMARTPYSRVQCRSASKGDRTIVDTYGAPSSSTRSIWERSQHSGSNQVALKRRFSVLDNDIGSIGPVRRIRPKPNLISSRGLSTSISTEVYKNPSTSTLGLGELNQRLAKESSEIGYNTVYGSCYSKVPSQSSEAASKIFKHLDKITPPKEKSAETKFLSMTDGSPAKLSPSMLRGQALKSLEDVDSSKFLENHHHKIGSNLDVLARQFITDTSSQKHDKANQSSPSKVIACDNSNTVANEVEPVTKKKNVMVKVKASVSTASDTVVHPPEKRRPFKMSAHEYLEPDEDDSSVNGLHVPASFADGGVKVDKVEEANLEKPIASTEIKPHSSFALKEKADNRTSDGVNTVVSVATNAVTTPVHTDKVDKNNCDAGVPFNVPETFVSSSSAAPKSVFSSISQVSNNLASQITQNPFSSISPFTNTISSINVTATSAVTTNSSNSFSAVVPALSSDPFPKFSVSTATTVTRVPENLSLELLGDKTNNDGGFTNQNNKVGTSATSAGTESSTMGVSIAPSFPAATNQSSLTFSSGSGFSLGEQASRGSLFKFEPPTAVMSGSSSLEVLNDKNKQEGSFGTPISTILVASSPISATSNSSVISATASKPTVTDQAPGTALFSGSSGTGSGTEMFTDGTGVSSSTQNALIQPGSSSSTPVFSFSGNAGFSSGSSTFSSTPSGVNPSSSSAAPSTMLPSTSPKLASKVDSTFSAPAFQFGTTSSAATNTSSISFGAPLSFPATSNSAASLFGTSSASASAPTFNSATIAFGMSSASAPTSNSLPTIFGASTVSAQSTSTTGFGISNGAPSSTGVFPFTSFANSAASQPMFGNSSALGFPSAPSGNTDQPSMEDSMAEDTVHASLLAIAPFGQQPVSPLQSTSPFQFSQQPVSTQQSTPFVFGGSTNGPFQSQPNPSNSQNPSPFQPSNGLANLQNPSPFQPSNGLANPQNPSPFQPSNGLANPQNPSPFQPSNSLGLTTNSFSLGAPDKTNRRIVKVNRNKNRKK